MFPELQAHLTTAGDPGTSPTTAPGLHLPVAILPCLSWNVIATLALQGRCMSVEEHGSGVLGCHVTPFQQLVVWVWVVGGVGVGGWCCGCGRLVVWVWTPGGVRVGGWWYGRGADGGMGVGPTVVWAWAWAVWGMGVVWYVCMVALQVDVDVGGPYTV